MYISINLLNTDYGENMVQNPSLFLKFQVQVLKMKNITSKVFPSELNRPYKRANPIKSSSLPLPPTTPSPSKKRKKECNASIRIQSDFAINLNLKLTL